MPNNKKGNLIIVVICIVVSLMIALVYLLKSTTSRVYTTKKLGNTLYARELANTLAALSVKYLKQQLKEKNNEIVEFLSLPLKGNETKKSGEKDLLSIIKNLINSNDNSNILNLLSSKSGLKDLKIEKLYWKVDYEDFKPIDVNNTFPYTREKYGLLHIYMTFSYVIPGKNNSEKNRNKENYHFVSDVSVVANIIPVLSRFTLYIDDALDGNKDDINRFNLIDTNANGLLNSEKYQPWILSNHEKEEGINKNLKSYKSILESTRGLVFIGGGEPDIGNAIRLGLAFGETDARTPYGEGLHFFYSEETGYWKNQSIKEESASWKDNAGMLTANFGLCNEPDNSSDDDDDNDDDEEELGDDEYQNYFEMTGGTTGDKLNSIFKLYGTDKDPSPTIVLGHVDAKYAAVKQFRFGEDEDDYDLLSYYNDEDEFRYNSSYDFDDDEKAYIAHENDDDFDDDLTEFAFLYRDAHSKKRLEYSTYLNLFSSRIECDNYNKGYASALNHTVEFPFKYSIIEGEEFKKLFNKQDPKIYTAIPNSDKAKYSEIYTETELGDISKFLDLQKLNINELEDNDKKQNYRISYSLKISANESELKKIDCFYSKNTEVDFIKYLKTKGILSDNTLDFNGWLFINNEADTDFILNLNNKKLVTNGGIILSNGNLIIKSDIESNSNDDKKILTLITLGENKDIIIDGDNIKRLDASLISKDGQVKLKGKGDLKINGNVVMKKIRSGNDGIEALKRGVNLNYNINLSAIPFNNTNEELNLLMYNLRDKPKLLKNE